MHGEYKTPAGKLVVVDLEVREDRLADVLVSGDFFLEPPEALELITAAIEGLPANAGEPAIAEQVRRGLGPGVEMIGFTPESIATAVARALR
jgi:hypothetical protein